MGSCLGLVLTKAPEVEAVRVRIRKKPDEHEMDGVNLDCLAPGTVRDVNPSIGSWLVAQGYAEPEMRRAEGDHDDRRSIPRDGDKRPHNGDRRRF